MEKVSGVGALSGKYYIMAALLLLAMVVMEGAHIIISVPNIH